MRYDFNVLEKRAKELINSGRISDALKIYYFMADGDPSLDGGYLGMKIAESYEALGDLHAAKYWYGRAVEENSARDNCLKARERLAHVNIASSWNRVGDFGLVSMISLLPSNPFVRSGTILPSRPTRAICRRAQRRSRMARLRATASAARSVLDGCEHDGMIERVGDRSAQGPCYSSGNMQVRTLRRK